MTGTVLLDGHHVPINHLDKTWAEYDNDIYYVCCIREPEVRRITLDNKRSMEYIEIEIPTEISFKSVELKVYTGTVIYTGEDVTEPTVMRIVKYSEKRKYSYQLEDENGETFWATPYEIEPIKF